MSKRILINGINLDAANLVSLFLKCKYWQNSGLKIAFIGSNLFKQRLTNESDIEDFDFIELRMVYKSGDKFRFMFEAFKSNLLSCFALKSLRRRYDFVYSISSMLDVIILPFLLKAIDKKIQWVTVFGNIVPLRDPGNKIFRFFSWVFFQISLVLLKRADMIFAISCELKEFLIRKGLEDKRVRVTSITLEEADLIRQAQRNNFFASDALFIGRINETKGIYDLLKVLDIVKKEFPDFRLAIMGNGDTRTVRNFKCKIRKERLENNIRFLGYMTGIEKFNVIKSSKSFWFLSVSESESFGVALLEAVCSGLPAFAYDLPAYKNIYKNNEVNIFKKGDYKSVAKKVIELFENGKFENKAGEALLAQYSRDKIAEIEYNSFVNLQ